MDENISNVASFLSDFSTRMNELEERLRILKERIVLISQTMLKQGERTNKEIKIIKESIVETKEEINKIKEMTEHIINESSGLARKEEVVVLEKYIKMFEPLKFTTEEDVKRIARKILEENKKITKEEKNA